jgi:hypothetical protein
MSQLYLIDRHGESDGANFPQSRILDVQESVISTPGPSVSGRFVVKVPDGLPMDNPTQLGPDGGPVVGSLLTQKALAFLQVYAGFTRVTYDDLLDTSNIDFSNSVGIIAGNRASITLDAGGVLQSFSTPLTGSAPSQVFITWDTYVNVDSDPAFPLYSRQYEEVPSDPSNVLCQVSFDGVDFLSTTDSAILNIPAPVIGTSFIMQLTNASNGPLSIGSWTLIY